MSSISAMGNSDMNQMQGMHRAHQKPDAGKLTSDLFSQLDPTGSGSIDSQSFLAALSAQTEGKSAKVTSEDASQFFTAMDSNADGKVNAEEMTAMFQKVSDQFQTRMQMMQQQAGTDPTAQQAMQGHRHQHGHKPDALNNSDALMQAVEAAQAGTTPATANATSTTDQLQRQLMQMMRRYEQMGAVTASTAATTAASPSVSLAA